MTLQQLSCIKRWQVAHQRRVPIEYHLWDLILTGWVLGIAGMPAAFLMHEELACWGCGALLTAPSVYVGLRALMHRAGILRCDWLNALRR